MLSLSLAAGLKRAGLAWEPRLHDFFQIPLPGLKDRLFVISDMSAEIEVLQGWPAITFTGSTEWAMDHVYARDIVWVPGANQLRQLILTRFGWESIQMGVQAGEVSVTLNRPTRTHSFTASRPADCLARALVALLRDPPPVNGAGAADGAKLAPAPAVNAGASHHVGAVSPKMARRLKEAGVLWQPRQHDFFVIPLAGLKDRLFVISDMTVLIEELQGAAAITFAGAVEWAMDYIFTIDVVWAPTEAQLLQLLQSRAPTAGLWFSTSREETELSLIQSGDTHHFRAPTVAEVCGRALLHLLGPNTPSA